MPLSWNEIRDRAIQFSKKWIDESNEHAEAKSFWDDFFNVFGVPRKRVASFEKNVDLLGNRKGYIDLLWKGVILIEHKSRGKDLDRAYKQAQNYFPGIKDYDLPQYILVCDFERFRLYEIGTETRTDFLLKDFYKFIKAFGFMAGYQTKKIVPEDPVNIEAAERMGKLHDSLLASGYSGHVLEVYLVRILFCLFAEDTGIFDKRMFQDYLEQRTAEDGNDLGARLIQLFHVLNTPEDKRGHNLDDQLKPFRYVNGGLFKENLPPADFNKSMKETLLLCCGVDWSKISPAIFGSLFQSVMDPKARRNLGAHYTSEKNILRLIEPLFLDDLKKEFKRTRETIKGLKLFQEKLASLKFLDPACGCGNFLIVTYREIRKLELEVLQEIYREKIKKQLRFLDIDLLVKVNVSQFYGIEIEEFPARIAEVGLWLADHQMNNDVSEALGEHYVRLPLTTSPNIVNTNSLTTDWNSLVSKNELSFILGNPPFIGSKMMTPEQREEIQSVSTGGSAGDLDYVSGWYFKAAKYIDGTSIKVGYVSTNSICQGEQVSLLWGPLLNTLHVHISFAHQTFKWSNEAKGVAAVNCIIVGFGKVVPEKRTLFLYEKVTSEPNELTASNINAYLVDAPDVILHARQKPLCDVPEITIGNQPIDGGFYLFLPEEKNEFIAKEPLSKNYFKRWMGTDEFLYNSERWCLWLGDCPPDELRKMPLAVKRVEAVKDFRLKSKRPSTQKLAKTPTRFLVERMPKTSFLVIPEVSSEKREYIPIGFCTPDILCSNLVKITTEGTLFHFGVLMSAMHMAWVRYTCGRLESRYRYSKDIVYNNYPWMEDPTDAQRKAIENAAQDVLDARKKYPNSCLADLYDPLTMPSDLVNAHGNLDKAVDVGYGKKSFSNEAERVSFLFDLYLKITSPLIGMKDSRPKKKIKKV